MITYLLSIDECILHGYLCQPNGVCEDKIKDYHCICQDGWISLGKNCLESVDDCKNNTCVHGKCLDGHKGFSCSCEDGWTGPLCDHDSK